MGEARDHALPVGSGWPSHPRMTQGIEWQGPVGRVWAEQWQRTDRSFAPMTAELLALIAQRPGRAVVDIGCGAGELSLAIAGARPDAQVRGIDLSPDLVAVARERSAGLTNCAFAVADAAQWQPDRTYPGFAAPDLYVSRHGVMFFANSVAAFAHLGALAVSGAGLCFSCFRSPRENPWASGVAALLPGGAPPAQPNVPGPFAFADAERVRGLLSAAGWSDVSFVAADFSYVVGAGPDPVADAVDYLSRIGPAARALRELPDTARTTFRERLHGFAGEHVVAGEVRFPAAAWLVSARRG